MLQRPNCHAPRTQSTGGGLHAWVLQFCVSVRGSVHRAAPAHDGQTRVRVRVCVPVPHVTLHVDHRENPVYPSHTTGGTGVAGAHVGAAQFRVSVMVRQVGSFVGFVTTTCDRVSTATFPQGGFAGHPDHSENADHVQAVDTTGAGVGPGQAGSPTHACVSVRGSGHAAGANGFVMTLRVRVCVPVPHVASHTPNGEYPVYVQTAPAGTGVGGAGVTGHTAVFVHAMVSVYGGAGHAAPVPVGFTRIVRERDCVPAPPPHVPVQVEYRPNPLMIQSWSITGGAPPRTPTAAQRTYAHDTHTGCWCGIGFPPVVVMGVGRGG